MGIHAWFGRKPEQAAGKALFASAHAQSRRPFLFAELGAPDTVEGRFKSASLHVSLLMRRLRGQGEAAEAASQVLVDAFTSWLDDGLREAGVGDTTVPKKMRKLAAAFHGRLRAYDAALGALPEEAELRAVIARTLLAGADEAAARSLSAYVAGAVGALASQHLDRLLSGDVAWPEA